MATVIAHSELVSRALSYIAEQLCTSPDVEMYRLVDAAAMRFNLSPNEAESLLRILLSEAPGTVAEAL